MNLSPTPAVSAGIARTVAKEGHAPEATTFQVNYSVIQ